MAMKRAYSRIERPIIVVLHGLLLCGCSKPTNSTESAAAPAVQSEYPKLVIDEMHGIRGRELPTAYQIAATDGIRLDATDFHFTYGTNAVTPNMVHLVGPGSAYRLSRPTEASIYVIDRTTLEAMRGGPFRGFRAGDKMTFAIGRSTKGSDEEDFWVSWAGQIEVK